MKKLLFTFFVVVVANISFSAKSIDLPKYYNFPENRLEGKFYDSTKDFLIVATDELKDSRFKNTVIIMLDHDKNGALGVVINKSLGRFSVDSLIKNLNGKIIKEKKLYNFEIPIFWGGPLDNDKIFILHSKDYKNKKTKEYNTISISNDRKTLVDIAEKKGPKNYLIINGLSAWTVGQLDGEIERGHWNLSEIRVDIIFEKNNEMKFIKATKNSFIRL
tara:strand:- start:541 stop:1194 length:654 start_codon:yes stop_codon:yes gene_type:complete